MPIHIRTFVVLLTACYSTTGWAHSVDEAIKQAETAYQAKDYPSAISHFEDAQQHGAESSELFYSLASAHFRSGNFAEAAAYYRKIPDSSPYYATALLNQGVIAIKQNQMHEADAYLHAAIEHAPDTQTAQLADELLARIENETVEKDAEVKPYFGLLSFGFGFEDTVFSPLTEVAGNKPNPFTDLNTYWTYNFLATETRETSAYAGGFAQLNSTTPEYNLGIATAGAEQLFKRSETRVSFGVESSLEFLDDSFLELSSYGFAKIQHRWREHTTLRARATTGWVEALDDSYEYNSGWQHRLRGEWKWRYTRLAVGALYEHEINQRKNQGDEKNYISYSPTRNTYRGSLGYDVSKKWNIQTSGEYRTSKYPENNIYNRNPIRREDERLRATLTIGLQWNDDVSYQLNYIRQRNDSTIATYDGTRNEFSIGVDLTY